MRTWRPVRACQVRIPPIPGWMTRIFRRSCTRYLVCKWHQTSPFPAPSIRWWDDSYFQSVLIANLAVLIIPIFIPPTSFELSIHLFYIIHFSDHIFFTLPSSLEPGFSFFCMRYTLVPGQSSRRRAKMEMRHARKLWQPVSSHLAQYVSAIFHVCITCVCSIICYVLYMLYMC